jgi:hypothetical protein
MITGKGAFRTPCRPQLSGKITVVFMKNDDIFKNFLAKFEKNNEKISKNMREVN